MTGETAERVDVLIVTAIKLEYDAVLQVDTGAFAGSRWECRPGPTGLEVAFRDFQTDEASTLRFAATYALEMGGVAMAGAAAPLVLVYRPRCLAMSGVCAGRRGDVRLGDVIVGDRLWTYDTGSLEKDADGREVRRFKADPFAYNLHAVWKHRAESFKPTNSEAWLKDRPRSYDEQGDWLMERLLAGDNPREQAERRLRCANFEKVVQLLRKRGWLEQSGLALSMVGRAHIEDKVLLHPDGLPEREDFTIHVGPIGTGTTVVRDPHIFDKLSERMRKVIGLEMEAAAIGAIAHQQNVERMIVIKGVMDYADPDKNDNFKEFAARASAECLIAFLRQNFSPRDSDHAGSQKPPHRIFDIQGLGPAVDLGQFIGRDAILRNLMEGLRLSPPRGCLIRGIGGQGKTEVARRFGLKAFEETSHNIVGINLHEIDGIDRAIEKLAFVLLATPHGPPVSMSEQSSNSANLTR